MRETGWIMTAMVVAALVMACGSERAFGGDDTPLSVTAATNVVKHQSLCPVMGSEASKNIFADYQGKRIYFCCNACPAQFNKDPAKYIAKLEKDGVTLDKVQTICPVTGDKIDKAIFADYDGKRVYLCCQDCVAKFNVDAKAIVTKMENDGIALDKADKAASAEKAPVKEHDHSTMQH